MIWPRERRWPLNLITKRYWPRKNRRSYHAPTASISRAGRIVRRQLPYRAPVVSRANSFCSAACFLPSESLVALLSSCARRSQEFGRFRPVPHLWLGIVLTVPRAQKREDQRAAGSPAALTQLALCLRLAPILRPKADNARNPQ